MISPCSRTGAYAGLLGGVPAAIAALCLWATFALAGKPMMDQGWVRPTPPSIDRAAVYLRIHNMADTGDEIVGVASDAARATELHTIRHRGGVMRMEQLALPIPLGAGAELVFRPGAAHVMLIGLSGPIQEGDRIPVTIRFAKAGAITVYAQASMEPPALYERGGPGGGHRHAERY